MLSAADLRQPRVRVVRVVVQPRDRAGRAEEDFSEGAVEPLVVLLGEVPERLRRVVRLMWPRSFACVTNGDHELP